MDLTMDYEGISSAYKKALETDSFKVHYDFLNVLLQDSSAEGMERHYAYFNETDNDDLKRILGKGFLKRGDGGLSFLLEKLGNEADSLVKSNIIHLIGLTYDKKHLPAIVPFLKDDDREVRCKAVIVCGWLGDAEAVDVLKAHYPSEEVGLLRGFTVSAMRQIYFRHSETKDEIVDFIRTCLPEETDEEALAIMIVVLQELTKVKYGLKENPCSGEVTGDVAKAKSKILNL